MTPIGGFSEPIGRALAGRNLKVVGMLVRFKIILPGLLSVSLMSCLSPQLAQWPDSIPPMQTFVQVYEEDSQNQRLQSRQEYLEWVLVFYRGNLVYPTGWLDLHSYIHAAATPAQTSLLDKQFAVLGAAIAAEWSRDNLLRRIDNRMLSLWGSVVQSAPTPERQQLSVTVIQEDVNNLLSCNLNGVNIREQRYEEKLEIDLFDGF